MPRKGRKVKFKLKKLGIFLKSIILHLLIGINEINSVLGKSLKYFRACISQTSLRKTELLPDGSRIQGYRETVIKVLGKLRS